ncbi:MAG: alkane 1-monooxygenase [Saprospiraceae bacterium]|nr:alkane 1-monooxygenase [Saprospiraceae bacterium]
MWKDGKYLLAYLNPLAGCVGLHFGGVLSFGAFYLAFVIIPLVEQWLPARQDNVPAEQETSRAARPLFDWLLYSNVVIVYGLMAYFGWRIAQGGLSTFELIGMTFNMGIVIGALGINVAHELGHRARVAEQWLARLLLVPALYSHFTIEHNYGHHKHVSTPEDPASARPGEAIYPFWLRSVSGSWRNAWKLERQLGIATWNPLKGLSAGVAMQVIYLCIAGWLAGPLAVVCFAGAAVVGFLLLESVNYIEHYGLVRTRLASGRYVPIEPRHSWNSNHELGRIFLYELTRHSDHHYRATRKYQILRHLDDAPQLPVGYPAAIVMALVPSLWRRVVDPLIPAE